MLKLLKVFLGTTLLLLLLTGSCIFYAFKIEPYRITTNEVYLNEESSSFLKVQITLKRNASSATAELLFHF